MTVTLADIRAKRDAAEAAEAAERAALIREKLVPLVLADIRGELSEDDGLSLLELCDDCEIDEASYEEVRLIATRIAADNAKMRDTEPQLEAEKMRFAKLTIARRRAEQMALAADRADRMQRSLRDTVYALGRQLEHYQDSHPYFFDESGEVLDIVADLPLRERPAAPEPKMLQCPICLIEYDEATGRGGYCSSRCEHIAESHADALRELKILPSKKRAKKNA